jgi:signal peptidase I
MEKLKRLLAAINLKRLNLKWVIHAIWIIALGGLFVYLNTAPPFLAVASNSMEPVLSRGDLIFSSSVSGDQIQVGDIIVFKVAPFFQEKYGYPATICHRVMRIQTSGDKLSFRTKGDNNASDDPFMTQAENLVGRERTSIPMAGYGVMFAQSAQGKYFLGGLIILFIIYANSDWIFNSAKNARRSMVGISTTEFVKSQGDIEKKMGDMTDQVVRSMNGFSSAMSEYAQHIASHTGAIKSLADAAKHMESILSKQDNAFTNSIQRQAEPRPQEQAQSLPVLRTAIEVTPELKAAVKIFIFEYNAKHGITSLDVTPDLRAAVWDFIQDYVKSPPAPEAGLYRSAIKTVKILPDTEDSDTEESERGSESNRVAG